jgi:hypothetical protein
LAVLHEKELILNATDTANILSTVGIVRELINTINTSDPLASLSNMAYKTMMTIPDLSG